MDERLLAELKSLRNQLAHGVRKVDLKEIGSWLAKAGITVPANDMPQFISTLQGMFGREAGQYYVPRSFTQILPKLLEGLSGNTVCDPWSGPGVIIAQVRELMHAQRALAFTESEDLAILGRSLLRGVEWRIGKPVQLLTQLEDDVDIVASVLPFNYKIGEPLKVRTPTNGEVTLEDDLGGLILVASALKLSPQGIGIYIVPQSALFSPRSVFRQFDKLGLAAVAAFALPPSAFAPHTSIATYAIVVKKARSSRIFVAQLTGEANADLQTVANFKAAKEGASLDRGRFVDIQQFAGINELRLAERIRQSERQFGHPSRRLGEIASAIVRGQSGPDFSFPKADNSIFIPLIGISDVVVSLADATLKQQNYAQVTINPAYSDARFVARFLNSELGREIREHSKSGFIPKLTKQSIAELRVFIPDLATQTAMLAMEALIVAERNTLLSLQNELAGYDRQLWSNPKAIAQVGKRLEALSSRLSGELRREAAEQLEEWFETLPFPMASILRAWRATAPDDYKTKYEHLLHFFEASAEFMGIILLSAFHSREEMYGEATKSLTKILENQHLSFKRATFGTWKVAIENLGKQVRDMLDGDDMARRTLCADMFADSTTELPSMLTNKAIVNIISATTKMRNNWTGHGGVVGQDEAKLRNEQLIAEVQKLREASADLWSSVQLVQTMNCRPYSTHTDIDVALLTGSNSEFLKETRQLTTWLYAGRLYLVRKGEGKGLLLLPLVQVGPSPKSAKNACYFFNRLEKDEVRFISYHYIDQPEREYSIEDVQEAASLLE